MKQVHFGRLLAKISGIDADELDASVKSSKKEAISQRIHFDLNDNLIYIKNSYEYFRESETHYLKENPVKHGEYNEKIAVYQTLENLKDKPDIDFAIGDLEDYFEYDVQIKDFLFENDYIESKELGDKFWDYVYDENDLEDIKILFDELEINSEGSKRDLVDRAREMHLYDEFNEFEFKLSKKGEKYFNNIKWIKYYLIFLDTFDFYEFDEYYNSDEDFMTQALSFIDNHINTAFERHDLTASFDAQSSKALYYIVNNDYDNALVEELKLFLTRLNPVYNNSDELVFHNAVNQVNIQNLKCLLFKTRNFDLKSLFNEAWDSMLFDRKFFNKKTSFKILIKALSVKEAEDINPDIEGVYFD